MSPILLIFNILPFYYVNPALNMTGFFIERFLGLDALFGQVIHDALKDYELVIFKEVLKTL